MKKILLSLCLMILIPDFALANVEFRFENNDSNTAMKFLHSNQDQWYNLDEEVVLSDDDIQVAGIVITKSGVPALSLEFTEAGQQKFKSLTTSGQGKKLAMLVDNDIVLTVTVRQPIDSKKINLPIDASLEKVNLYAAIVNAAKAPKTNTSKVESVTPNNNVISERLNQQTSNNPIEDIQDTVSEFATGFVGKKLFDFLVSNWIFIFVGFFFILPILKKIPGTLFSLLKSKMFTTRENGVHDVSKKLPSFFTGRREDESATDKGQRLIGDGRFKEAIKYLRVYTLQNPKDVQASTLLMNAREWSGMNQQSTLKQRQNKAHDAQRKVQAEELRARSSSNTKVSQARSSLKMNKEQALRMAQSVFNQHKN